MISEKKEYLVELRLRGSTTPTFQKAVGESVTEIENRFLAIKQIKDVLKVSETQKAIPNICLRVDGLTHTQRNKIKCRGNYERV